MTRAVLRTDGGARGNPGPAGAGFVIEDDGRVVCGGGRFLGETTNNVAEYSALIWGLENAAALGYAHVIVYADSELLVKQVNGAYRVKNEGLKPLFAEAMRLLRGFPGGYDVRHVRREQNKLADEMANQAMDARGTVGDPACGPGGAGQATLF
ncbi:MAG: ribonuclease HI family protein [Actinobacteria bacterium]|nr:MAG: ribonuclease HI family protein [Actinomycetota bacterium]